MLTHDLDFGAILAATQGEKPSVAPAAEVQAQALRAGRAFSQLQFPPA